MSLPSAIDAFCGAGGLSLGLKRSGFKILVGFDLDAVCIETHRANQELLMHPVVQADVRELSSGKLLELAGLASGELDLLAGGPPCQGFSTQRTSGDDNDERNLLVNDYGDLIQEIMPRFFLMENVPGIGGRRGRAILAAFLERMEVSGYWTKQIVLDAKDYGVPQRRRRVFVVGERRDGGTGANFRWPAPAKGEPPTVRDAIAHFPPAPSDGSEHPTIPNHRADKLSERNKERLRYLGAGQSRADLPANLLAECHLADADTIGHRNVYGRMAWDEVAPTITARFDSFTRGKFGHPEELRSISLREGAALQTFPDNYRFIGTKVEVARQIGNAVPPLLAEAVAAAVVTALRGTRV